MLDVQCSMFDVHFFPLIRLSEVTYRVSATEVDPLEQNGF